MLRTFTSDTSDKLELIDCCSCEGGMCVWVRVGGTASVARNYGAHLGVVDGASHELDEDLLRDDAHALWRLYSCDAQVKAGRRATASRSGASHQARQDRDF